jgi:large subunit ribosomal protein L17
LLPLQGTPHAHSKVQGWVKTDRELHKLLTTLVERYKDRPGGYTRVVKSGRRQHDAAKMAFVE